MTHVVYLTRNGLLEPLGQSQVFGYLRGLSREHQITLITFEKSEDWANEAEVDKMRNRCDRLGIRWLPQRFNNRLPIFASLGAMLRMLVLILREKEAGRLALIHARSYIPAGVALMAHRMTGVPFIFDMRALWPEELITAGRIRRSGLIHRALSWLERSCLREASAVVSLTHAAVEYLKTRYENELFGQHIAVIPTCADLDRFVPINPQYRSRQVQGCIGTVLSGWFRIDWLAAWMEHAAQRNSELSFEIVTRDDPQAVRQGVDPCGTLGERLKVYSKSPDEMPETVCRHDLSIMFYAGGNLSELGRSPTRMAEVLGCGIPVIVNRGVGDVASIVEEYRVGVVLEGSEKAQIMRAFDQLGTLMTDEGLARRCRSTADALFSLEAGTDAYRELYSDILTAEYAACAV